MMSRAALFVLFALACRAPPALAHEVRPGYLELKQTGEETYDVLWKVPAAGDNMRLGIYVRFPEQTEETSERRGRFVRGSFIERWSVRHPGGLTGQTIHIDGLRSTLTDVLVRFERMEGSVQVVRVIPESPLFVVLLAPSLLDVIATYSGMGVEHILLGIDHLLFVLALLLIVADWKKLIGTITAFTVAHSITLALATLGLVHVPGPPVEAIIALSIVFVAAEILHTRNGRPGLTARSPWIVAFVFGLLHGFGFAGALNEIGLPEQSIPLALLFFNVGVELGQILFIAGALAVGDVLRRVEFPRPSWAWQVPAYGIGAVAAFWTIERVAGF